MFEQTFETSASPHLVISECLGNLTVSGSEEREIHMRIQGEAEDASWKREGEALTFKSRVDCLINCPPQTTLTINAIHGNLKVAGLKGSLAISTVHGNLTMRSVGPTAVEQTFGNLSASQATAKLELQDLKGNAQVEGVNGALLLGQVGGNLNAEGLDGGLEMEKVRGNIRLGPPFSPGATYRVNSDGNLTALIPADANLRLTLRTSNRIRSTIPELTLEEIDGGAKGILGAGEASLEGEVKGNISLKPAESEEKRKFNGWENELKNTLDKVSKQIELQVNEAVAKTVTRLEESLHHIDGEKIGQRVDQVAEQTRRKAERAAERARLRAEKAERRWQRASGQNARSRQSKQDATTDEEWLRVLRMVEEGKVTPEQASELLAALGGR